MAQKLDILGQNQASGAGWVWPASERLNPPTRRDRVKIRIIVFKLGIFDKISQFLNNLSFRVVIPTNNK